MFEPEKVSEDPLADIEVVDPLKDFIDEYKWKLDKPSEQRRFIITTGNEPYCFHVIISGDIRKQDRTCLVVLEEPDEPFKIVFNGVGIELIEKYFKVKFDD